MPECLVCFDKGFINTSDGDSVLDCRCETGRLLAAGEDEEWLLRVITLAEDREFYARAA
jgi:hypothetical protein